jgi:hypothetical protein
MFFSHIFVEQFVGLPYIPVLIVAINQAIASSGSLHPNAGAAPTHHRQLSRTWKVCPNAGHALLLAERAKQRDEEADIRELRKKYLAIQYLNTSR